MVFDGWLFTVSALLVLAGILMVGSASHYVAMSQDLDPYHYLVRHIIHALLGVGAFIALLTLPYSRLSDRRVVTIAVVATLVALLFVLAMPAVGGAHRWLQLGPFNLQPSEFAKLAAILFMASILSRKEDRVNDPWSVTLPCLAVIGLMALLIVIEPDLGSAVMLSATAFVMIFVAGLSWRYIGATAVLGAVAFAVAVWAEPFRLERLRAFLDPMADPYGSGFQLTQSLIALGSGGLTGVGIGQGHQEALYLPAPHTDFIFSVMGEELGLVGTSLMLVAFLLLFWRGLRAALRAPDRFGFYLALGVTTLLVMQGLVHMGVCVGLMPTKGLPLPLVSYGGSSLMATLAAMGVLLNVSQHSG